MLSTPEDRVRQEASPIVSTIGQLRALLAPFADDHPVQVLRVLNPREGQQLLIQNVVKRPGWHTQAAGMPEIVRIVVSAENRELRSGDF